MEAQRLMKRWLKDLIKSYPSAAIVYLAHNANQDLNWLAICNQFGDFCAQSNGAVETYDSSEEEEHAIRRGCMRSHLRRGGALFSSSELESGWWKRGLYNVYLQKDLLTCLGCLSVDLWVEVDYSSREWVRSSWSCLSRVTVSNARVLRLCCCCWITELPSSGEGI
ncbi:unnamed protein product [Lupinus luteus]|uniref:CASP-like protein n=1 Tax=Lupinus luteus TaxID=3873 RepID=A0AAV1X5T0_LUPLU